MKINFSKNYPYFLFGILAVFLLFVIYVLLSSLTFSDSDTNFSRNDKTSLYPDEPVIQKFSATRNNLNQINIALKNVRLGFHDQIKIELADSSCDKTIAQDTIGYFSHIPGGNYPFKFKLIPDSENKNYCLKLTFIGEMTEKKSDLPYLTVSSDSKFSGYSFIKSSGEVITDKSLVFEPAYSSGSYVENILTLDKRMSQYKPWFFKGDYLITIFILFFISALFLAVLLITI